MADHLDRYGSMAAYFDAKAQIILYQGPNDIAVRNLDDRNVAHMAEQVPSQAVWFSGVDVRISGAPTFANSAFWQEDMLLWRRSDSVGELICRASDVKVPGDHNRANIAAAAALAKSFGVETEHICNAIRGFTGVEHRLEFVREIDGVRYVNDTAATAPEAAIAALRSFDRPIVLIAGGADKNLPFDDLAREIALRAQAVVLLQGSATPKLIESLARIDDRPTTKDESSMSHAASFVLRPASFVHGPYDG